MLMSFSKRKKTTYKPLHLIFITSFFFFLFFFSGPDYIKQRFQEGMDAKENPEEKVPEKPPTPKESPHFYRKGTTPPRSPEASPKESHSPQPPSPKPTKKQNPSSGVRLSQDKRSVADEQVTAIVNKPLMSKAPSKEAGAIMSKYSGRHHVPNPSNGELHSQYHGYYVKLNAPQHRPEAVEEEDGSSQSPSALAHRPSPNKWSPPKSVTKPVAKESKAEPKAKKSELAIPKNPASNDSCPSLEKEANSVSLAPSVFSLCLPFGLFREQRGLTYSTTAGLAQVLGSQSCLE
jgi:junctophilin